MLIIDANCVSAIFNTNHANHANYRPILNFLFKRKGIIVTGGTLYLKEIGKVTFALQAINELQRKGQVRVQSKSAVDTEEERIKILAPKPACNDQHLIALVSISGARVIASDDKSSDRFLKDQSLYPAGRKRPSIYRNSRKHSRLINVLPTL